MLFIVFCVWKKNGTTKFFPSNGDNPSWSKKKEEWKKYRFGVREVEAKESIDDIPRMVKYKSYDEVTDGVNVRATYQIVELHVVETLQFKVGQ